MKRYAAVVVSVFLAAGTVFAAEKADLQTEEQKFSYAMGLSLGKYFKELEEKFDLNLVQDGIKDGYDGEKVLLTDAESQEIQQAFSKRQHDKQVQKTVAMIQKNRKAADEFLAANKGLRVARPGFVLLARPNDGGALRFGITVTKKIGNAVVRNRMKRRFRALARERKPRGVKRHVHRLTAAWA